MEKAKEKMQPHKGMSDEILRDFFSDIVSDHEGLFTEEGLGVLERELERTRKRVEATKRNLAIKGLMQERGWEDWDQSDLVPYNPETYRMFIGSEEEFEDYTKRLKERKE
jgi:hypothetical protein